MRPFILSAGRQDSALLLAVIDALPKAKAYRVEITETRRTRSLMQNAYLWGVVYPAFLSFLPGWDADDLHEYFLGEHFGWEVVEGFGRKRMKPIKRSSKLNKMEFADFVDFIQRKGAEMGVYVPDPNEYVKAA
mgnify:CR=1 FL=1